jgi:phosphate-selective porin OprO and OprP
MFPKRKILHQLPFALPLLISQTAQAQQTTASSDVTALELRLADVEQRAAISERKLELQEEAELKARESNATATANEKGFRLTANDKSFEIRFRGLLQIDGRQRVDTNETPSEDTFTPRRVRPYFEATFWDLVDAKFMPDFGNGKAEIIDAYFDVRPSSKLKLRAGKFRPPVGLERLRTVSAIPFLDRALPTALVPNRDVGAMLWGGTDSGAVNYELGIFNGVRDGASADVDADGHPEYAARLQFSPLADDPFATISGLTVGLSATYSNVQGSPATFKSTGAQTTLDKPTNSELPSFRTVSGQTFLSYTVNDTAPGLTTVATGTKVRLSPQLSYFKESFGLLSEYVRSSQRVARGTSTDTLNHQAWQVALHYVLGGALSYKGPVVRQAFATNKDGWGALQLSGRYNELDVDNNAFAAFATSTKSASRARAFELSASWHLNNFTTFMLGVERTQFRKGGALANTDRPSELVIYQRAQLAF